MENLSTRIIMMMKGERIKMPRVKRLILIIAVLMVFAPLQVYGDIIEHSSDGYYTVYEEGTEKEVFMTSWDVSKGDEYLSGDNRFYEVTEVDKDNKKAYAKFIKDVKLPEIDEYLVQETFSIAQENKRIALYFSHNAESYVPTDGSDSKPGKGGIVDVGEAFKKAFEENGVEALIDDTSHEPHDANAYVRSRRTAVNLLQKGLDALFDIHRDAVPKEQYIDEIKGTPVSKVRIVLGRRNQNIKANEELAYKIKAVADKLYPGLVKDIYYARGSYNQNLAPRALLFEFGTHTHTRERAENAAEIFADVVTKSLYGGQVGGNRVRAENTTSKGSGSGILWIILVAVVGGLGFLFLSTGGKEMGSKVKNFTRKEFGSFLARRNNRRR